MKKLFLALLCLLVLALVGCEESQDQAKEDAHKKSSEKTFGKGEFKKFAPGESIGGL